MEEPDYIHPKLEPILRETFGVIVYQEQVMQAAQLLAGYSLGEADLLRRAMGKKIRSEMQKQRSRFVSGCVERDIDRGQAETIFELLERFADYGFNKSHAAAYALVAYQTAYMKANYPVEFLAASMTLDMGNTDKLSEFRAEAERLGVKVEPPSVNRSGVAFEVDGNTIHYALAALKGVGRQAVEAIVEARGDRPFADLSDFASRINPRAVNKRVLESLAAAGAFDALEGNRARVFAAVDAMLAAAQREHDAAESGALQFSFGGPAAKGSDPAADDRGRGCRPSGCRRSSTPSASSSPATRSTIMPRPSSACGCSPGPSLRARCARARARAGSPAPWWRAPSGAPAPAARWASSGSPIRPAITRRCCSPKGWRSSAICSSPARRCC